MQSAPLHRPTVSDKWLLLDTGRQCPAAWSAASAASCRIEKSVAPGSLSHCGHSTARYPVAQSRGSGNF